MGKSFTKGERSVNILGSLDVKWIISSQAFLTMGIQRVCWATSRSKGLFQWKATFPMAGTDGKPTYTQEISPVPSHETAKAHTKLFSVPCSHHPTLNLHLWAESTSSLLDHIMKTSFLLAHIWGYSLWFQTFSIASIKTQVSAKEKRIWQAKTGGFRSSRLWNSGVCAEVVFTSKILC